MRDKCPWLWDIVEWINAVLFVLRYGRKMRKMGDVLKSYGQDFRIYPIREVDVSELFSFFQAQPQEDFTYFRPHGFDVKSLRKLQRNKAFLAYVVKDKGVIAGYFLLRSFFIGKCYRGYMVDHQHRGLGINKLMARIATDIASLLGLRTFGTIAPENLPSLNSSKSVNNVKIIKTLKNGDYYVEYCKK